MAARVCQHLGAEVTIGASVRAEALPPAPVVGICVRCGTALCDACLTKVDGINHCRACLSSLLAPAQHASTRAAAPQGGAVWLSFVLGLAALAGLAWTTLTAVLPTGAP